MTILAFDTCFGACSAALWSRGTRRLLAGRFEVMEKGHSERIVPMIAEVLTEAGAALGDVTRLAVTVGPGSFTGVRTGLSVARALTLATVHEICGTTSLHVMAAAVQTGAGASPIAVAVATRDGLLYFQAFDADASPRLAARLASPAQAAELIGSERHVIVGSGAAMVAAAALGVQHEPSFKTDEVRAEVLARMAEHLPVLAPPQPLYLREPDAKPQAGYVSSHLTPRS